MPRKLKIALAHYHLKVGGVTTVLRHQVEAIRDACEVVVLTGEAPQEPFPAETVSIQGLGYDQKEYPHPGPRAVADAMLQAIHSKWSGGCDLLHVHNPTLAKNRHLLQVLFRLQERGVRLFLQVHDFAEDGRPHVYTPHPYPADCHWAVINSRDYRALMRAGLKPGGLHRIPNAVHPLPQPDTPILPKSYVLYPVRALRRKNIGEAILLSLLFKKAGPLRISLPPNSPRDIQSHEKWKQFVHRFGLRVLFDTGFHESLASQAAGANFFITTSITEGFGFSFLEPWTIGKSLSGRKLPEICADFEENGLSFQALYDEIRIPLSWIDAGAFFDRWKDSIQKAARAFAYPVEKKAIRVAFEALTKDHRMDFGMLDEAFQEKVLLKMIESPDAALRLETLNPRLLECASHAPDPRILQANQEAVKTHYSMDTYRQRLLRAYIRAIETPVRHQIDKEALLKQYFDLNRWPLLKWGDDLR